MTNCPLEVSQPPLAGSPALSLGRYNAFAPTIEQ
jgi:hypothetical protein